MKRSKEDYMKLQLGDIETTALIPLAVKASDFLTIFGGKK